MNFVSLSFLFLLGSMERSVSEALAWAETRDHKEAKLGWRFTTADALTKLKRLYPSLQE